MKSRSYDAASPIAQKLNQEHPEDPRPPFYLGVILRERKAYANAERYLLESVRRDGSYARAYDALGILYGMQSRLKDALIAHQRSVELAPKEAQFWHNLGFILTLMKRYDASIDAYQQALALAPEKKKIYLSLGVTYGVSGSYPKAQQMLIQALSSDQAWLQLATLQERRGDLEQARESLKRALVVNPQLREAREALKRIQQTLDDQAVSPERKL